MVMAKLLGRLFDTSEIPSLEEVGSSMHARATRVPSDELVRWVDNALSETGRALTAYQHERDAASLHEAHLNAQALMALMDELKGRQQP